MTALQNEVTDKGTKISANTADISTLKTDVETLKCNQTPATTITNGGGLKVTPSTNTDGGKNYEFYLSLVPKTGISVKQEEEGTWQIENTTTITGGANVTVTGTAPDYVINLDTTGLVTDTMFNTQVESINTTTMAHANDIGQLKADVYNLQSSVNANKTNVKKICCLFGFSIYSGRHQKQSTRRIYTTLSRLQDRFVNRDNRKGRTRKKQSKKI